MSDGWFRIDDPKNPPPKDGTRVLAYWPDVYGNSSAVQIESWFGPWSKHNSKETWQNCWEWADGPNAPTHWRPLPPPPVTP